jgi:hypothetical protein
MALRNDRPTKPATRIRTALAPLALAAVACSVSAQEKTQPKPPKQAKKGPLRVFILAGQSNMLG